MPWPDWHYCGGHRRMPCIHLPRWRWSSHRSWWYNCYTYGLSHGPHTDIGHFVCHIQRQLSHVRHKGTGRTRHPPRSSHQHIRHSLAMRDCRDTSRRHRLRRYTRLDRWYQCGHYIRTEYTNRPFHVDCQNNQAHTDRSARQCNPRRKRKSRSGQFRRRNVTWMGLIMFVNKVTIEKTPYLGDTMTQTDVLIQALRDTDMGYMRQARQRWVEHCRSTHRHIPHSVRLLYCEHNQYIRL